MTDALETLATGYGLVEGPCVDAEGALCFSDVIEGGVYRRTRDGRIETLVPKRRGVGGIALHADGGIVISGRNVCHVKDGVTRVLFEREDIAGFNDLTTDGRGRVLVGSMRTSAFQAGPRTDGELYRIDAADRAVELYGAVSLTNGVGFSPDGERLYHSDTARNQVVVHERAADDAWKNRRVFARLPQGAPDGLAVDVEGFVWVAAYGGNGVYRFDPRGEPERHVAVPARQVASVCFGGDDGRDLYITTADNTDDPKLRGTIFRARAPVPGLSIPPARI